MHAKVAETAEPTEAQGGAAATEARFQPRMDGITEFFPECARKKWLRSPKAKAGQDDDA
jgi:hypothetical protein